MKLKAIIPFALFVGLVLLFFFSLGKDTRLVPSALIDKPAPEFSLKALHEDATVSPSQFKGQRWLLNVWASWCAACRQEHPLFNELAEKTDFTLVGLNYKDTNAEAKQWLIDREDPYSFIAVDDQGAAGFEWGVYGVPETFLIDEQGMIKYKHVGPVTLAVMNEIVVPFLASGELPK
jgi:cytochrome c biogenesis protein CcmG/thiol:disulfide interchange protein DsbE